MKPVITFVLGVVLATAVVMMIMRRDPAPVPVVPAPVAANPAPVTSEPQPVVPEPAPGQIPRVEPTPSRVAPKPAPRRETRAAARPERNSTPTFSSTTTTSQPPASTSTPTQTASNSSTTTTGMEGGIPQTTIHMPPPPPENKPVAPVRVPKTVTIPAGTLLAVRVDERLSSDVSHTGDSFRATLEQPLVVDGAVIAERGARVEGRITESDAGGRVRGTATLALELVRLNTSDGQRLRLQTDGFSKNAQRSTKKDVAKVGIGAGLGAAIGAIAGGGKGAAIGAGIGGAAGTGAVMTSRGEAVEIPSETRMTFRLSQAVTVTEKLN